MIEIKAQPEKSAIIEGALAFIFGLFVLILIIASLAIDVWKGNNITVSRLLVVSFFVPVLLRLMWLTIHPMKSTSVVINWTSAISRK